MNVEERGVPWTQARAFAPQATRDPARSKAAGEHPNAGGHTDLRAALVSLRPVFHRAAWYGLISGLLVLVPTAYMVEVYGRVVDTRNSLTLLMLTLLVLGAYLVMEALEFSRAELLRAAGVALDRGMRDRVFHATFKAGLRRLPGAGRQALEDLDRVRDFLHSPLMLALMGAPLMLVFALVLFGFSPWLGATALAGAVVQGLITWSTDRRTVTAVMQAQARE